MSLNALSRIRRKAKRLIPQAEANRTVIEPQSGWNMVNWREVWRHRDLFYFLVLRDVKVLYKQTALGFTWAIIQPVFSMIVFTVVFGRLAKVSSDGVPYPIFHYTALVPWTYFAASMTGSTQSLIGNVGIFTKVYFPRLFIPMTPVIAKLVDFGVAFIILLGMMVVYHIWPTVYVLFLPYLILMMIMTAAGIGMWLSALAIQYRDIKYGVQFLTQLLMYAAPVVWPASLIPVKYRLIYGLYPMAGVIEGFRSALLGTRPMPWDLILSGSLSAGLLFFSGLMYFRWKERIFADVA